MISIDYKDRKPIYEQLVDNIKTLVIQGVLQRDDQLPSVRQLAGDLAINPNTIQKAYTELERQGITYSLKGRGCFIASNIDGLRDGRREQLFNELTQTVQGLLALAVPCTEIQKQVAEICQNEEGNEGSNDD